VAARLQEQRFEVIGRIAALAESKGAQHVLVAGDVFDAAKPPQPLIRRFLARLADHPGLIWHCIAGNHDPDQPGAVWDDVRRAEPGPNVRIHASAAAVEIAPAVVLLPAPLHARAMSDDPTAWMDGAHTPAGSVRIGMAHGSVRGFSSQGEAAIPIAPDRAATARLDYLALGDWHGTSRIDARTWYAGTPEPDGFKDNAPGHALVVTAAGAGAAPKVEQAATAYYTWRRQSLDITGVGDIDRLIESLRAADQTAKRTLLDLDVSGRVPLADFAAVEDRLETLAATVAHLQVDRARILPVADAADLDGFGTGAIATVAAGLAGKLDAADARQQAIATRALAILARLNGEAA
jgi:DNA repair exonuclease SbcCD nuclease subunit